MNVAKFELFNDRVTTLCHFGWSCYVIVWSKDKQEGHMCLCCLMLLFHYSAPLLPQLVVFPTLWIAEPLTTGTLGLCACRPSLTPPSFRWGQRSRANHTLMALGCLGNRTRLTPTSLSLSANTTHFMLIKWLCSLVSFRAYSAQSLLCTVSKSMLIHTLFWCLGGLEQTSQIIEADLHLWIEGSLIYNLFTKNNLFLFKTGDINIAWEWW